MVSLKGRRPACIAYIQPPKTPPSGGLPILDQKYVGEDVLEGLVYRSELFRWQCVFASSREAALAATYSFVERANAMAMDKTGYVSVGAEMEEKVMPDRIVFSIGFGIRFGLAD